MELNLSIIPAIVIFLTLLFVLNRVLFQPLLRVQADRESRTTGRVAEAAKQLDHYTELFDKYQTTIKDTRMEGYRLQEDARSRATTKRTEALGQSREKAEQMALEARNSIQEQVQAAKTQLEHEAQEMAHNIVAAVLKS